MMIRSRYIFTIFCAGVLPALLCWNLIRTDEQERLLTKKPWNYNCKLEGRKGNGEWKTFDQNKKLCDQDDVLRFGIHNTYEVTNGKIRCEGEKAILKSGTWLITAKGKLLMDTYSITINILNKDTLQVTRGNGEYQDRYTYLHK